MSSSFGVEDAIVLVEENILDEDRKLEVVGVEVIRLAKIGVASWSKEEWMRLAGFGSVCVKASGWTVLAETEGVAVQIIGVVVFVGLSFSRWRMVFATVWAFWIARTTVEGPARASPATNMFGAISRVFLSYWRLPCLSSRMPLVLKKWASLCSPIAEITVSAAMLVSVWVETGLRRPVASGAPRIICSQRSLPFSHVRGDRSSLIRTFSLSVSSISSASAGI